MPPVCDPGSPFSSSTTVGKFLYLPNLSSLYQKNSPWFVWNVKQMLTSLVSSREVVFLWKVCVILLTSRGAGRIFWWTYCIYSFYRWYSYPVPEVIIFNWQQKGEKFWQLNSDIQIKMVSSMQIPFPAIIIQYQLTVSTEDKIRQKPLKRKRFWVIGTCYWNPYIISGWYLFLAIFGLWPSVQILPLTRDPRPGPIWVGWFRLNFWLIGHNTEGWCH